MSGVWGRLCSSMWVVCVKGGGVCMCVGCAVHATHSCHVMLCCAVLCAPTDQMVEPRRIAVSLDSEISVDQVSGGGGAESKQQEAVLPFVRRSASLLPVPQCHSMYSTHPLYVPPLPSPLFCLTQAVSTTLHLAVGTITGLPRSTIAHESAAAARSSGSSSSGTAATSSKVALVLIDTTTQ
jgi:hypothetical protein